MLRPFAAFLHDERDDAARGDQLRAAVRADPARARRSTASRPSRWSSAPRSTPTGCWPVRRTCSASSTPPRPARPPATTCSTTGSTTRSSPPSWPPASPRPCCTAGPAPPAPRASPSGPDTRACGRCSPSGSTPGSRASEFYPLWTAALGRYQCVLRQGKPADRRRHPAHRPLHRQHAPASALFDEDGDRIPDEEAYGRRWMRNRENHWWQDLGMQDAGWTYEFFDGSLLLHDDVSFADGLVQPDGPGYQALIVYQSELDRRRRRPPARLGPPGPEGADRARRPRAEAAHRRTAHAPTSGRRPARRASTDGTRSSPPRWPSCSPCPPSPRSTTRARPSTALRDLGVRGTGRVRQREPQRAQPPARGRRSAAPVPVPLPLRDRRADRGRGRPARRRAPCTGSTAGPAPSARIAACGRTAIGRIVTVTLAPARRRCSPSTARHRPARHRRRPRHETVAELPTGRSRSRAGTPASCSSSPRTADSATRPARSARPRRSPGSTPGRATLRPWRDIAGGRARRSPASASTPRR